MPRSEVNKRFLDNLQAWHRVVIHDQGKSEEIVAKGTPKKIGIAVKKRQGKKLVTIIDGKRSLQVTVTRQPCQPACVCILVCRPGNIPYTASKASGRFTAQMRKLRNVR